MLAESHVPAAAWTSSGCSGVPEPDPVQAVPDPAGPDDAGRALARRDDLVQAAGLLEAGDRFHDASAFLRP
jgi:hypothetical protein